MVPCICVVACLVLFAFAPDWVPWVAPGPVHPLVVLFAVSGLCGSWAEPSLGLLLVPFPQRASGALVVMKLNRLVYCLCALSFQEVKKKNSFFMSWEMNCLN